MIFTAFLRAVNVGGHAIIKMEELKRTFESLSFKDVKTFIQSGNVIFSSAKKNSQKLEKEIQTALSKRFEYEIITFIRTNKELADIINKNPFSASALSKDLVLYIAFLQDEPAAHLKTMIEGLSTENETYNFTKRELYCLIRRTSNKTIFSNNWVETKLKMKATSRNWNTINKMNVIING